MLKIDKDQLDELERDYPGISDSISRFEEATLPACSHCGSTDTAKVQCGIIGRTISIAAATTRIKLLANGPVPGEYFCNTCNKFCG